MIPIREDKKELVTEISTISKRLISLKQKINADKTTDNLQRLKQEYSELSKKIDNLVYELYGIGKEHIKLVEEYRRSKFLYKFDSPALFIPFVGIRSKKPNSRISTNYFQEKIADYRRRLGIQIPTSAHSLRHGFATYMAEDGASAVALQILLGHESLETTTKYVHASEKFAEETVRKNHPLK